MRSLTLIAILTCSLSIQSIAKEFISTAISNRLSMASANQEVAQNTNNESEMVLAQMNACEGHVEGSVCSVSSSHSILYGVCRVHINSIGSKQIGYMVNAHQELLCNSSKSNLHIQ